MKTYITLNINLSASKHLPEGAELHLQYAEDYIHKSIGEPSFIGVFHGAAARTLVVQYKYTEFVLSRLYRLARDLKLDYIAYHIQDGGVLNKGVVGDYAYAYAYNYDDFVVASTNLFGCSGVPLEPTQAHTYTKASDVEQAYDVAAAENCSYDGCYSHAVVAAHELGGIETYNGNDGQRKISPAPTRKFVFDDESSATVTYGGVFLY